MCREFKGMILLMSLALMGCDDGTGRSVEGASVASAGAEAAAPTEAASLGSTHLALATTATTPEEVVVEVRYHREQGQDGPRVAEIHLRHDDGLQFVRGAALDAATSAGKELTVQDKGDGTLRLVLLSTANLTPLDSGGLAALTFERRSAAAATVEILPQMPIFAPPAANEGVRLPEPLEIAGL